MIFNTVTFQTVSLALLTLDAEHLMVWFQMESFPTFIKLYGKIDQKLEKGTTLSVTVSPNTWDVAPFDGKKYIYLSTVNSFGGTNKFLGAAFLVAAGLVLVIMVALVVLRIVRGRDQNLYSLENMKWK